LFTALKGGAMEGETEVAAHWKGIGRARAMEKRTKGWLRRMKCKHFILKFLRI